MAINLKSDNEIYNVPRTRTVRLHITFSELIFYMSNRSQITDDSIIIKYEPEPIMQRNYLIP